MNTNFDYSSIKGFGVTVIFGVISLATLNYLATIITICVGITALIINIKKIFKK